MLFSQISGSALKFSDLAAVCGTLSYQDKLSRALCAVEQFLRISKSPVISAGFGKDSMATVLIARSIDPTIPIICGDPPNALSDREEHIRESINFLGGKIIRVPYQWDVAGVLAGEIQYPEGLKQKILSSWQKDNGYDGVILGVRKSESRARTINHALRGDIYRVADGTWRCLPISDFTAEESLATAIHFGAPINGVYRKTKLVTSFSDIRDGTWWPHGQADSYGYGEWIKLYYPEHYEDYLKATLVSDCPKKYSVCVY